MKFTFSLETVKRYRGVQEDLARGEYSDACRIYDSEVGARDEAIKAIEVSKQWAFEAKLQGGSPKGKLESVDDFIVGRKAFIKDQEVKIEEAQKVVDEKFELLTEASKEKKVIEKLEEKKFEEYKKELKKKEIKDMDEMVVNNFGRRDAV